MMDDGALAVFVTPHGYGHAGRVCAVLSLLRLRRPQIRFEIYSTVPEWFIAESIGDVFGLHPEIVDVGLIQRDAFAVDVPATCRALDDFLPFADSKIDRLAADLLRRGCGGVRCDVAVLGLVVGQRAGLPTVLVENFTWDWIYREIPDAPPDLRRHAATLERAASAADLRLRAHPACGSHPGISIPPVCRMPRRDPATTRDRLGVPPGAPLVLVTMGGFGWEFSDLDTLRHHPRIRFVIPGSGDRMAWDGALLRLPHRSGVFHPDLVAAADVVVGKLGYGTVVETAAVGGRFAFVARPGFPESPVLESYVRQTLTSEEIAWGQLATGRWIRDVERLLERPPSPRIDATGADTAAQAVLDIVGWT